MIWEARNMQNMQICFNYGGTNTVKLVYNDHRWDPKIVAVIDRWSLFRGHLCNKSSK